MKAGFHYLVKAKLIRYKSANEIKFMEFEEKFEDSSPILARDAAFHFYQNYIDVLLEAIGKEYISDKQAREELQTFIRSGNKTKFYLHGIEFEFDNSSDNGIGVFLVIDIPPLLENDLLYHEGEELIIHGIGHPIWFSENPNILITELEDECKLYDYFNYDTKDKSKIITYCNSQEWKEGYLGDGEWLKSFKEPNDYKILETPFDWTGYDKPYWWKESNEVSESDSQQPAKTIRQIIDGGEGNYVEFKPALLYNFKTCKAGIGIKKIIATAICAFLNGNGGYLFIGLDDNGRPQGLKHDFSLANGKKPKDFFQNEFDQMIEHFLSFSIKSNISARFCNLDSIDIFMVTILPSKNRAVFLNGQNGKEFWIRGNAGNRQLKDIEEIAKYCIDRWTK